MKAMARGRLILFLMSTLVFIWRDMAVLTTAKIVNERPNLHRAHFYEVVFQQWKANRTSSLFNVMTKMLNDHQHMLDSYFQYIYYLERIRFWGTHKTWTDEIWLHTLEELDQRRNFVNASTPCPHCGCLGYNDQAWKAYLRNEEAEFGQQLETIMQLPPEKRSFKIFPAPPCYVILRVPWMRARHFTHIMEFIREVMATQLLRGISYASAMEDDIGPERLIGYDFVNWGINLTAFAGNAGRLSLHGLNMVQIPALNAHYSQHDCQHIIEESEKRTIPLSFVGLFGPYSVNDPIKTRKRVVDASVEHFKLKEAKCFEWRYSAKEEEPASDHISELAPVLPVVGNQTWCAAVQHLITPNGSFVYYRGPNWLRVTCKSKMALAPRGNGASSYRLFELLQLGISPVYIWDKVLELPYSTLVRNASGDWKPEDHWIPINPNYEDCVQLPPHVNQSEQPHCWRWKDLAHILHINDFEETVTKVSSPENHAIWDLPEQEKLYAQVVEHFFTHEAIIKHMVRFVTVDSLVSSTVPIPYVKPIPAEDFSSPLTLEEVSLARKIGRSVVSGTTSQLHVAPKQSLRRTISLLVSAAFTLGKETKQHEFASRKIDEWACDSDISAAQYCGSLKSKLWYDVEDLVGSHPSPNVEHVCQTARGGKLFKFAYLHLGSFWIDVKVDTEEFTGIRQLARYIVKQTLSRGFVPQGANSLRATYGTDFLREALYDPPDHIRVFSKDLPHTCFSWKLTKAPHVIKTKNETAYHINKLQSFINNVENQKSFVRKDTGTYGLPRHIFPSRTLARHFSRVNDLIPRSFTETVAKTTVDSARGENSDKFSEGVNPPLFIPSQEHVRSLRIYAIETISSYLQYIYSIEGLST